MATLHNFEAGGYAFLEGGFPYSAGVIAMPGHAIVRVRLHRPLLVAEGFAAIQTCLSAMGRPLTALCAAELRSPKPFSFDGFREFNQAYVAVLEDWGLYRNGLNPVARSNVCPQFSAPGEPVFHAFCFTVASDSPALLAGSTKANAQASSANPAPCPDFVVAGSGEWPEDQPFPEGIVARGDISPGGLATKADYVLRTMRERTDGLGGQWSRLTAAQIYTVHDFHPLLGSHFEASGLHGNGLSWHVCRPPITELEFEMDVRSVRLEQVLGLD